MGCCENNTVRHWESMLKAELRSFDREICCEIYNFAFLHGYGCLKRIILIGFPKNDFKYFLDRYGWDNK